MQNQGSEGSSHKLAAADGARVHHRRRSPQDLLKRIEALFLGQHKEQTINQQPSVESNTSKRALLATNTTTVIAIQSGVKPSGYIPKRILNRPPPIRIPAVRVHNARMQEIEIMKNYSPLQVKRPGSQLF